jgi:Na+/H+ antiporter 1/RibD C-terminal domain
MPFRRTARRVLDPVVEFLRIEAVGGAVLLAATIAALALANSPLADSYQRLWHHEVTVGGLRWDLRHWVNDALMTIFFLVIGLEVKRELTIGRLRDPRRATLPIVAALAGAAVPALVFLALNPSGPAERRAQVRRLADAGGRGVSQLRAAPGRRGRGGGAAQGELGRVDVIGSGNLVQTLLRNDLVDRLNLWVLPVLLGRGKRLFAEGTVPTALRLVESATFPTGAVHLTYERAGKPTFGSMA